MRYMDIFTAAEWQTLQLAFCSLLPEVAIADGKIDKKEQKALDRILNNTDNFNNDLVRELLKSVQMIVDDLCNFLQTDTYDAYEALTETCVLLDNKVDPETAFYFKKTLIAIGYYIANASGRVFQNNVSDPEIDVIMKYIFFLKMTLGDVYSTPNVKNIKEFLIDGTMNK